MCEVPQGEAISYERGAPVQAEWVDADLPNYFGPFDPNPWALNPKSQP